jgi:hypothetical protein
VKNAGVKEENPSEKITKKQVVVARHRVLVNCHLKNGGLAREDVGPEGTEESEGPLILLPVLAAIHTSDENRRGFIRRSRL